MSCTKFLVLRIFAHFVPSAQTVLYPSPSLNLLNSYWYIIFQLEKSILGRVFLSYIPPILHSSWTLLSLGVFEIFSVSLLFCNFDWISCWFSSFLSGRVKIFEIWVFMFSINSEEIPFKYYPCFTLSCLHLELKEDAPGFFFFFLSLSLMSIHLFIIFLILLCDSLGILSDFFWYNFLYPTHQFAV